MSINNIEDVSKLRFTPKHIRELLEEELTHEELAVRYGMTLSQVRIQLARFMPTIIYDEDELYREFDEYIKRNNYMNLFRDLEIPETTRKRMIHNKPVFAKNLLRFLKFFDVKYEIRIEKLEDRKDSIEYPKYIIKLPKFSKRNTEPREVKKPNTKSVNDDYNALLRARERELSELHKMIGVRRNTLSEVLKRKGHSLCSINQILDIVDEMCIEVSEFSIKSERYGAGNQILDNIAKKRIAQYE